MFSPAKATSTTCSGTCRNTLNARSSIQERADKRRRTGKPTTYIKVDGRHEHRQVMERVLGRALTTDEIVHHKNGDMTDNRPENLEVVTRAEHIEIHRPEMQAARKALLGF
jgi:cytochrome oxidase Cu insertion factor (SCO1/SenC/PrrC family)